MDILGRDAELQGIERSSTGMRRGLSCSKAVPESARRRSGALQSIGRTQGLAVCMCSPSAAEANIGLAALGDLLADVDDDLLDSLPAPHRRALKTALLRTEAERPPEGRALALGVARVLETIANQGPLVVAIDDAQWLDLSSRQALTFAARRLEDQAIHWLIARRQANGHAESPLDLERTFRRSDSTRARSVR